MVRTRFLSAVVVAVFLGALACSEDTSTEPGGPDGEAPGFSLVDVNPNSATYDSTLSPRDYQSKVSAWYFGHAT